jgi:hypothetical protein
MNNVIDSVEEQHETMQREIARQVHLQMSQSRSVPNPRVVAPQYVPYPPYQQLQQQFVQPMYQQQPVQGMMPMNQYQQNVVPSTTQTQAPTFNQELWNQFQKFTEAVSNPDTTRTNSVLPNPNHEQNVQTRTGSHNGKDSAGFQ